MVALALAVRLDLGAPVTFAQRRAGLGGAPFTVLKLRTMRDDRGPDGAPLPDALRTTRLGGVLRRLRLDELPQLFAIASGRMAWIGPRPLLPDTVAEMGEGGALRCAVRPGLTGWAQVSGNTLLDEREKLALDLWYVRRRGPALDGRIVAETAWVVLFGERRRERRVAAALESLGARPLAPSDHPDAGRRSAHVRSAA